MNGQLRIAWSVGCGVVLIMLIALWTWSHWASYLGSGPVPFCGTWLIETQSDGLKIETGGAAATLWSGLINPPLHEIEFENYSSYLGFIAFHYGNGYIIKIPYWFPVLLSAGLASLPWIRPSFRFSLRTLLFAMTLVAVGLGLAGLD
jgi:hypothetical protein